MYVWFRHDDQEDQSERQDRLYLTWSLILEQLAVVALSGRPHSIAREPLQDATMRSGRPTQAIAAGSKDEFGRTADPPSS